jgi:hypothetical protein
LVCRMARPASTSFCQSGIMAGRPWAILPGAPSAAHSDTTARQST